MIIEIENITFGYDEQRLILDNVSLQIKKGEILGILGPNGTGKTTLLKCLNGILRPQQGRILVNDKNILTLTQVEVAKILSYVPQYTESTFSINVLDTVLTGRLPYAGVEYSEADKNIAFAIMEKLNLEQLAFNSLREISGGERQRTLIARALAQQTEIIVMDEPTTGLDIFNQLFTLQIINSLVKSEKLTVIMSIHDLNLASLFCDKVVFLKDKHIFAHGTSREIITEENIVEMYGVKTKVSMEDGYPHVRLLKEF